LNLSENLDELVPPGFPGAAIIAYVQPEQLEVARFNDSSVEVAVVEFF